MTRRAARALVLAAVLAVTPTTLAAAWSPGESPAATVGTSVPAESVTMGELVNGLRAGRGLPPLTQTVELSRVAQAWAERMASGEVAFGHNPVLGQEVPRGWSRLGENVAYRSEPDLVALHRQWVNSPAHYENMIGPYTHIGTAVARSASGWMYGVQVFATYPPGTVTEVPPAAGLAMHRLYNPNSGEHFYTAAVGERDHLVRVGWLYEGIGWRAPDAGQAVHRLYNPYGGGHHYTVSTFERDHLVRVGWLYEGVSWQSGGEIPVYRAYNPNDRGAATHHYTTNAAEVRFLVSVGWHDEGIGWYASGTGVPQ